MIYTLAGGANSVGIRFVLMELDPFWAAGSRFMVAGVVLTALAVVARKPVPTTGNVLGALLFGLFGAGLGTLLVYLGLQEAPAALAVLFLALVPLLTMLLGSVQKIEVANRQGLVGAALAFVGIAVIAADQLTTDVSIFAVASLFAAAMCLAQGGLFVKKFPPGDPVTAMAIGMTAGGLLLLVISAVLGEAHGIPGQLQTWIATAYLILPGSVLMFVLALYILKRWSASATSYSFLLYPFVTAGLATALLAEPIRAAYLVGGTAVLGGVYLGAIRTPRRKPIAATSKYVP